MMNQVRPTEDNLKLLRTIRRLSHKSDLNITAGLLAVERASSIGVTSSDLAYLSRNGFVKEHALGWGLTPSGMGLVLSR